MKKLKSLGVLLFACSTLALADVADSRKVIRLTPEHRAVVLNEMQLFLSGLQKISEALARDDMETVARVSRSLGTVMSKQIPAELKQALPQEFRKLGGSVHRAFDRIALDAEALGDTSHTLSQLATTMSNCVSCHSMYQIRSEAGDR